MASPTITLKGIEPFFTVPMFNYFNIYHSEEDLKELSSPKGRSLLIHTYGFIRKVLPKPNNPTLPANFRVRWLRGQTTKVSGVIFMRVTSHMVQILKFSRDSVQMLSFQEDKPASIGTMYPKYAERVATITFRVCSLVDQFDHPPLPTEDPIELSEKLVSKISTELNQRTVRKFFENNETILTELYDICFPDHHSFHLDDKALQNEKLGVFRKLKIL